MKPNAIYSKSGKGVQEASGKTSLLKRADRAVLSAIDGRATLAEVAQKVGKSFDAEFEKLISTLDKDGFVREVSTAPPSSAAQSQSRPGIPAAKPAAAKAPAPKPAASSGGADDLDFTSIMPVLKPGRPAAPAAAPAKPAAAARPAHTDAAAQQRAKEQEAALYKARQEAEARAQAERDRIRQETEAKARAQAEAKIRAETEKKLREEADARQKAEGDAKAKAAREAAARLAAEVKAKAEADARARTEAEAQAKIEKAQREAEELRQQLEAERKAREAEERRRNEEEERRRREEDERRAREEAERQAREQAEKAQREAEELRQRLDEERQAREAEERKRRELEEARRAEAEQARMQQARELEQARTRVRAREQAAETAVPALPSITPAPGATTQFGAGSLDALMADLDSFSQREEAERRERDAAEQKDRDEKKRRVQEDAERRAREQAAEQERERQRAAEDVRRREEEERRAQEAAERRVREAEEQRRAEAEERKRRAQELAARPKPAPVEEDIKVTDDDLGMDDVRRDESAVAREARKAQRAKEREARRRADEARARAEAAAREAPVKYPKAGRPVKWGRPLSIGFFVALVAAVAVLHVMPLPMADYEAAASEAFGRPVKVGSAHLSLFTGVRLDLSDVTVGDRVRIAKVHAYPRIGSLFDDRKAFRRVELIGAVVPQQAIGGLVSARLRGRNFEVERIAATDLKLDGPVPLPAFEADAVLAPDGAVRSVTLRGPDSLDAKLTPSANGEVDFDVTAASLAVPFVPELSLASFAMKGSANGNGMKIASWGGAALDGVLGGSANVRWASAWQVDGTLTVRGINAAWFAPALLSEGKAEGSARFSMSGADPAKLHSGARMEGNFSVGKGALGTFDLSRLLQTSGRQHGGRTPFTEMTGHATYDRGAVALRNVNISAGALTAGASADIAPGGALAGRIVADVRTTLQPLRGMLVIGGTVKEPQVRN